MKTSVEKQDISPVLLGSYKLTKKIIKYSFYLFILYFVFKGFMA
ncbi:hypothetical protein JOE44_004355 [Chryseobacterium sp. PvR013]|nr:hypothetical protein [Chryseobacterium sp. PvR013]